MKRHYLRGFCVAAAAALTIVAAACSSPAAAPTSAPAPKTEASKATPSTSSAPAASEATKAPSADAASIQKPADWPKRSIQLIVPYDAGGTSDVGMRLLAPGMEKALGTQIEVVNKPGAGSQVGVTEIAKAKPDGYTIGMTNAPQTQTIYMDKERQSVFKWDSFAPIGLHVFDPGAIAVATDSKYKSVKDIIDDAKANPEKVKVTSTGVMGDDHLAILQLEKLAGVKFATVHTTGTTPALTALLGGHTDVAFNNIGDFLQMSKQGKIRVLAVMDKERSKQFFPDVPTFEELGYKLYSSSSRGLSAPKGTPKEVVNALSQAMKVAMDDPSHVSKMAEQGLTLRYMDSQQFDQYMRDYEKQVQPLMDLARQ